jgi:endonuclease/exonuclease/phosphatase family metal-dependent hydrolase
VSGSRGTENELDVLADVYVNVRNWEYSRHGEDDFILLGDLNSPSNKLFGLERIPGLESLTAGQPTNTAGTRELDHILIDTNATAEFTRQANVLDFTRDLNIPPELATAISDHRPVWAQFSAFEVPPYDPSIAAANQNQRQ